MVVIIDKMKGKLTREEKYRGIVHVSNILRGFMFSSNLYNPHVYIYIDLALCLDIKIVTYPINNISILQHIFFNRILHHIFFNRI